VFGLPRIAAQIRWSADDRAGLLFNHTVELRLLTDWLLEISEPSTAADATIMADCTSVAS
jgi:hypothetical protein